MMKLLLIFDEFFLYLSAPHRNLNFLEQTYSFLVLLTQLNSLISNILLSSWLFQFRCSFFFCYGFSYFPVFFHFVAAFLLCRGFFVFPSFFSFAVDVLFYHNFFVLPLLFCLAVVFSLPWLFCLAVFCFFCSGYLVLRCTCGPPYKPIFSTTLTFII